MRLVVVLLNVMPLYVMNREMNEWMPNEVDRQIVKFLFNAAVFMTLLSYSFASFTRPKVIPQLDPSSLANKTPCLICKNWKPQRTHHCSVCGVCVPKMDHHCPWLGNCVGYHNFKPFFLFAVYQAITGIIYAIQLIQYIFFAPEELEPLTPIGNFCFWMTNVFGMLISVALIPLSLRIAFQIYNNISSIEMI